jgi:hypothetical protein
MRLPSGTQTALHFPAVVGKNGIKKSSFFSFCKKSSVGVCVLGYSSSDIWAQGGEF